MMTEETTTVKRDTKGVTTDLLAVIIVYSLEDVPSTHISVASSTFIHLSSSTLCQTCCYNIDFGGKLQRLSILR
eukprot:scaffold13762_cov193-Alexandrium_tamarense.AAC.3